MFKTLWLINYLFSYINKTIIGLKLWQMSFLKKGGQVGNALLIATQ